MIMVISAFLALLAASFIQIPWQLTTGRALVGFWGEDAVMRNVLVMGIPAVLISGFVQEAAKLAPILFLYKRRGSRITPLTGLMMGAAAGAGFAVFEAQWVHNMMLASGWSWEWAQDIGLLGFVGIWERFVTVPSHIAFSALAGYGLVVGKGWRFYVIVSLLHAFLNYSAVLMRGGVLSVVQVEIYATVYASAVTAWALRLRWRRLRSDRVEGLGSLKAEA